ncbi:hypothetical protein [Thalassiella azotivora]
MATTRTTRSRREDDALLWAAVEAWDCSTCGEPMPFEALPCADGHDDDCPDRICVGCGTVVVVGLAPLEARSA